MCGYWRRKEWKEGATASFKTGRNDSLWIRRDESHRRRVGACPFRMEDVGVLQGGRKAEGEGGYLSAK